MTQLVQTWDWQRSHCSMSQPGEWRAWPPLHCWYCLWNCNRDHNLTASSPKKDPMLHGKCTCPLSIMKNIGISYSVCQGSKCRRKTHIHTPLVPCFYCTEHLLPLWISVVTGSVLHRVNRCQTLQTHQDEVLLPDGQVAGYWCLQVYCVS